MGNKIPRSCRIEYIILLWDLMRAMWILALEGEKVLIRRRALDTVGGSPRQRMLDKLADAGKLAPSNRREQSHAKAIRRIRHDVAPGFCYSGLTPLFKGN